jgi:peptidoglycan/xylan/chitin deacetylase (PgdA/CDA1 family)
MDIWPIDKAADKKPDNWKGWPDGKKFVLIISHDIESIKGYSMVRRLVDIDNNLGIRATFNFVPKKYKVEKDVINLLKENGHEIGVHGLYHDGKLFSSLKIFNERYPKINEYIKEWGSSGFYAPSTLRNLDWIHNLNIEYDSSTFDTDPFEPQPDGLKSVFPVMITKDGVKGYVEIPYTLAQDFTLFILLKEKNIDIWKQKVEWLAENGGIVNVRIHPDYINFENKRKYNEYPLRNYIEFIEYIKDKFSGLYWNILPKELSYYWLQEYGDKK